jgi:FtsZ-binding cell division protein ZapB
MYNDDENVYEILDFGNIEDLVKKLKSAKEQINNLQYNNDEYNKELNELYNKHQTLNIKHNSLNIRHKILKSQKNFITNRIITKTKQIDGKLVTTTNIV